MTANRLNAESAGFLPPEYNSEQLRYELNRIHKRIDDLLAQGIQTIKAVRVDRGPVELDSSPSVLECDTAVVAIDVQLPLAADCAWSAGAVSVMANAAREVWSWNFGFMVGFCGP